MHSKKQKLNDSSGKGTLLSLWGNSGRSKKKKCNNCTTTSKGIGPRSLHNRMIDSINEKNIRLNEKRLRRIHDPDGMEIASFFERALAVSLHVESGAHTFMSLLHESATKLNRLPSVNAQHDMLLSILFNCGDESIVRALNSQRNARDWLNNKYTDAQLVSVYSCLLALAEVTIQGGDAFCSDEEWRSYQDKLFSCIDKIWSAPNSNTHNGTAVLISSVAHQRSLLMYCTCVLFGRVTVSKELLGRLQRWFTEVLEAEEVDLVLYEWTMHAINHVLDSTDVGAHWMLRIVRALSHEKQRTLFLYVRNSSVKSECLHILMHADACFCAVPRMCLDVEDYFQNVLRMFTESECDEFEYFSMLFNHSVSSLSTNAHQWRAKLKSVLATRRRPNPKS